MSTSQAHGWTEHPDLVGYYSTHRNEPGDMYPSERRFLPWLATQARSVLDVGCGAGGFSSVWRSFQPALRYTGVDISAPLLEAARAAHPGDEFIQADCAVGLPLADRYAEVTAALGWLHWEERHARALHELWRVTDRYLFFDLRLVAEGSDVRGSQRLELTGAWDGHTTVPYVCRAWPEVADLLLALDPKRILSHGYWGQPAGTVAGVSHPVCFATFVLERAGAEAGPHPEVALDLPLSWPEGRRDAVRLLGVEDLERIAPDSTGSPA